MYRETHNTTDYQTSSPTTLLDRLPPQNIEAEEGVIGAVVHDNEAMHEVIAIVTADDFWRDSHRMIFQVLSDLYAEGKPFDGLTIADELQRRDQLKEIGGDLELSRILNGISHSANAKYHAGIVQEKAIARRLIGIANQILRDGYSNNFTAEELLRTAEQQILDLAAGSRSGGVKSLGDILDVVIQRVRRRKECSETEGIPSGWHALDAFTGTFKAEQLIILAGRPGMGKSACAWNIADYVAVELGGPVLFISLEMGEDNLAERSLAARGRVDGAKIRTGDFLGNDDMRRVEDAYSQLKPSKLFIGETSIQTMLQISAQARRLKSQHGLSLVVVDYLQLITPDDNRSSRQEQISLISRRLKLLARELKVPVIALSQLNRKAEDRDDHRPRLSDLRESGAIENDADVVLLLHRPDYYDKSQSPGMAEMIVAKNRNGETGTIDLKFHQAFTRFDGVDFRQEEEDIDYGQPAQF